jgi:hypothetical protein
MDIEFAFHTDDAVLQDFCRKYWQQGTDGKFVCTVDSIALALDVATSDVSRVVNEHCTPAIPLIPVLAAVACSPSPVGRISVDVGPTEFRAAKSARVAVRWNGSAANGKICSSRSGHSKESSTVAGAIQRMAERAIAEGWQTTTFRRDFRAPLSTLSHVLFTSTLRQPDDGFTTVPPSEELISSDAGD